MSTTLNTRVQSKRDTSANWTQNNPVLLDGEVIIVDTNSGDVRFKVGDGVSTYTQLPFQDEYVLNQIPDVSSYVTAQDPVGVVPTIPPTFDGHTIDDFVLESEIVDNLNSVATNAPLSANQGNVLNQNISTISSGLQSTNQNLNQLQTTINDKLSLTGGSLSGSLTLQPSTSLTGQVRNIYCSTSEPTASDGVNGDIWIVYGG